MFLAYIFDDNICLVRHVTLKAPIICCTKKVDGKIVILDYANEHPKMGWWKIAEHFSVEKTAVSNILKDGKNL